MYIGVENKEVYKRPQIVIEEFKSFTRCTVNSAYDTSKLLHGFVVAQYRRGSFVRSVVFIPYGVPGNRKNIGHYILRHAKDIEEGGRVGQHIALEMGYSTEAMINEIVND